MHYVMHSLVKQNYMKNDALSNRETSGTNIYFFSG